MRNLEVTCVTQSERVFFEILFQERYKFDKQQLAQVQDCVADMDWVDFLDLGDCFVHLEGFLGQLGCLLERRSFCLLIHLSQSTNYVFGELLRILNGLEINI